MTETIAPVRRRIVVAPGEMTCTGCGEIAMRTTVSYGARTLYRCPICGNDDDDDAPTDGAPPLVPTTSYLHEHEYVVAG